MICCPELLWAAPHPIPVHALVAMLAIVLGAVQFGLAKGTVLHRGLGYIWVVSMAVVALSSFWIHEFHLIGPFSPIHLLSVVVLRSVWRGVRHIRQGRVHAHQKTMVALYWQSLLLAGAFTLLPGRVMYRVIFG